MTEFTVAAIVLVLGLVFFIKGTVSEAFEKAASDWEQKLNEIIKDLENE